MKSMKPWATALQIAPAQYESWSRDLPRGESLTLWCLKTARIDIQQYLNWAKDYYGIPLIQNEFFGNSANTQRVWRQIESMGMWNEYFIPIAQWDGVLFIACLEPDMEINWSFSVQYLLAHPTDLKRLWEQLSVPKQGATISLSSQPTISDSPTAPPESISNLKPTDHVKTPELLKYPKAVETASPEETPKMEMISESFDEPAGLNLHIGIKPKESDDPMEKLLKESPNLIAPEPDASVESSLDQINDIDAPVGLSFRSPAPPLPAQNIITIKNQSADPQHDSGILKLPDNFEMKIPDIVMPSMETPLENLNESPPEIQSQQLSMQPEPAQPAPAQTIAKFETKAQAEENTNSVPVFFNDFIRLVKSEFIGGMILKVHDSLVKPLIWDENFNPLNSKAIGFWSLTLASALRVAYRTKLPYLGQVIETQTNSEFFKAWGFSSMPESILIQPLMFDEGDQYLMLALVDPTKKNHHIIASGEKFADEIKKRILNQADAA